MNSRERFDHTLAQFIHRKRTFFTGSALVWAALFCVLLAFAFILVDIRLEFAAFWRWLALGSLLGTAAIMLGTLWLGRNLRYRRQRAIRELETVRSDLGQLLRTSDELGDEERARAMGFSPVLADALARQAGEEIEKTPTEQLLPWQTVRRAAIVLAVLVLLGVLLVALWPDFRTAATRIALPSAPVSFTELVVTTSALEFERDQTVSIQATVSGRSVEAAELQVRPVGPPGAEWQPMAMVSKTPDRFDAEVAGWQESFEFRIVAGKARTKPQIVRFIDPPRVEECTATIVPPEYTRLEPYTVGLQRIVGVVGSHVRIHGRLNHALTSGSIDGPDGEVQTVPGGVAEFDFDVELAEGSASYTMHGQDAEKLALKSTAWKVRGVVDNLPTAKFEAPAENLRVTKITEIPIDVRISDDFGIAEAGIVLTIDGKEHRLVHRTFDNENPRRLRLEYLLPLEKFAVEVNANVRLHAYAADRLPDREGRAVSELRIIDIRPLKILYRLPNPDEPPLSSEEQQQLEEQMAKLDDAIKAQQEVLAESLREREERAKSAEPREELAQKQEQVAQQLQALREQAAAEEATPEGNDEHMEAALAHMEEAAKDLREPEMSSALREEDEALAELLRARNQLEQELKQQQQQQQTQQQQKQQQQPEPPPPLDDLAQRVEELAKKEEALAEQAQEQTQPAQQQAQDQQEQQAQQAENKQAEQQAQDEQQQQAQQTPAEKQAQDQQQQAEKQQLAKQQQEAVAEANQLLEDVQQHPETTPLAEERMAEARDKMQEAAEQLAQNQEQQAQEQMQEAKQDLQRLAEHLRGLDQENVLETMEKARDKAEQAAQQLEQLAQQQQQNQQQAEQQAQDQKQQPDRPQEQQAQSQQQAQQQTEQQAQNQQQAEQQAQNQQQAEQQAQNQQQAQNPADQREEIAREAETLADWAKRMSETKTEERERVAERLEKAQDKLETEQLAEDIRQVAKDQQQGREEQAAEQDRKAAERLRELAKTFEEERKELVRDQLQRLAEAEAKTKQLAEEVEREAKKPTPTRPDKPTTEEKLSELAEDYQKLKDQKMEEIGKELQEQVGPQNQLGGAKKGTEIPEEVASKALDPGAKRLRQLIDEIVEREMLIDRDRRVPEQYAPLVDTYFQELSDDARE